ncbi:hypothetical protein [Tsuneonella sp. HG222]
MARTVFGLLILAAASFWSPTLAQEAPPGRTSTVHGIDHGAATRDEPLIGPPDSPKRLPNEIVVIAPCSAGAAQRLLPGSYIMDEKRSDNAMDVLNAAIRAMPPSVARLHFARRLRKAGAPVYAVKILFAGGRFWIKNDAKRKVLVSTGEETIKWTLDDGQVFDVSAQTDRESISLKFRAIDSSERTIVYCGDKKQLVTQTTITGPLLATPVYYRIVYNRIADTVDESEFVVQAGELPSSLLLTPVQANRHLL